MAERCYDCKGLGRVFTPAGAEVYRSICNMLGIEPLIDERRRVEPGFMRSMAAEWIRPGMRVRRSLNELNPPPFRDVIGVEEQGGGWRLVKFADRERMLVAGYTRFSRALTAEELDQADVWLAQHIGKGAIVAPDGGR